MRWPSLDEFRMLLGLVMIIAIVLLAIIVARENAALQSASNGDLQMIITVLAALLGGFTQWAFPHHITKINGVENKDK